ncbi:hypothetical protein BN946_scf184986.g4 [Trametes cinnabarina]|uniref:Glucose-methanol-choline oxidoreductase C-terminal domain-containing protein n=1 Tax=Pycnoporus cinnabarinus TaxID=5643 RepID=A0A060SR54_PYCCI|nr:hypothetical protein BN946_scf184986.g4 [Trametes cinnabarina]
MVKFTRNLRNISSLKEMTTEELNPGPDVQSDEEITDTASSCSMLLKATNGVVDPELKVYDMTNLHIMDLSVVPLHFAAHPQATVYAIAEQAADIICGNFQAAGSSC